MDALTVAKELYNQYSLEYHSSMDEMKMHKLMYFTQRESLMYNHMPLFDEPFCGWRYGPVLKSVRNEYKDNDVPFSKVMGQASGRVKKLVSSVLKRYGGMSSWKLSELSHGELSWKRSRRGLASYENGNVELELSAMKVDAARELALRNAES